MDQADLEAQAVLQGSERPGLEASWYTLVGAPFLVSVGNGIYARDVRGGAFFCGAGRDGMGQG